MKEHFTLKSKFEVSPNEIYRAWLDSAAHSEMTGGEAVCSDQINEEFSTWDGYITGKNKSFIKNREIIQSWRTVEFAEEDEDSLVTIKLKKIKSGTELTLVHVNIPEGQTQYKQGWLDHYFTPMKYYFGK